MSDRQAAAERDETLVELCSLGLLTCTTGQPGAEGAGYALAWLPLDNAELHSAEVQRQHAINMQQFTTDVHLDLTGIQKAAIEQLKGRTTK